MSNPLLQFTSQGHLLGFSASEFYISNATYALRVEFLGAQPVAPASDKLSTSSEHGAPPLSRVIYSDLWDGITLAYDATRGLVSSSYRLEPQADPAAIHLRYNVPVTLKPDGTLTMAFATGQMTESAPQAWQEVEGTRVPVRVAFAARGDHEIGFAVGEYDATQPLSIDPTLIWTTFFGASGNDTGYAIAVDSTGNIYITGNSGTLWGSPIRAKSGGLDAFVAKLSPTGNLLWNTFLGGSGTDGGAAIAVDASGNVYVGGYSDATWQGASPPVNTYADSGDAFVARLTSDGALTWNTFLGGDAQDIARGIAVDASGYIYLTGDGGAPWGSPSPPAERSPDAFAAKLDPNGALIWDTFLGSAGIDFGGSITVDASGSVYIAGSSEETWGSPVRAFAGGSDGFAARLTSSGALVWNTFLGGSGIDVGRGIDLDDSGNIYIAGFSTATWSSPVRPYSADQDAFAAKLNSSGGLLWNTFLGGIGREWVGGIVFDSTGVVYIVGSSNATWSSPIHGYSGGQDAFIAKLNSGGALLLSTFLGTSGTDMGHGIAADGSGNAYLAGESSDSWGSPILGSFNGGSEASAAKLNSALALSWNTFVGGSGLDEAFGIAVDGNGNTYVAGFSASPWGSPVHPSYDGWDGFVAKLNPGGNLVWNTFVGGEGTDTIYAIAVTASGNVYLAGESDVSWGSPKRPFNATSPGPVDGFAAKLDTNGVLLWNTFLGGDGFDVATAVAIDAYGNAYVAGDSTATWGSPKRAFTASSQNGFAARLDSNGALVWNTFLGGTGYTLSTATAVDSSGSVYVVGRIDASWGLPVRAFSGSEDAFVAKLNGNGVLLWNTFLGGSAFDSGTSAAVDAGQNIYVGGASAATWGTPVRSYSGGSDAFAAKLNANGVLQWSTFVGGTGNDDGDLTVDGSGNVYIGGSSNATWGSPILPFVGDYDAFASKLGPTGVLMWNTFLGGNRTYCAVGIAADSNRNVYLGGHSTPHLSSTFCGDFHYDTDVFAALIDALYSFYVPFVDK